MKKTLMFLCAAALCATAFAQQHARTIPAPAQKPQVITPAQDTPAGLKKLFSNLGASKTAAFYGAAWLLTGPNSVSAFQQWVAMPFTVKAASTVDQVQVAIQYNASGANQINLSIYTDNSGTPGTLIAGPITVTNLPSYFECCTLTVGNFSPGVSVAAATQYWVVADTPTSGLGSDFEGTWDFVPPAKSSTGFNQNTSWFSAPAAIQEPAGAVYGTTP